MLEKRSKYCLPATLMLVAINLIALDQINLALCIDTLYLPSSMKADGKITLEYAHANGEIVKHHLVFSELIDSRLERSKLSIGYISYEPVEYHSRQGRTLELSANRKCSLVNGRFEFIRELNWFLKYIFTDEEITSYLKGKPYLIGPSGTLAMITKLNQNPKTDESSKETYRNIDCRVQTKQFSRVNSNKLPVESTIKYYVPSEKMVIGQRAPYFTVKFKSSALPTVSQVDKTNLDMVAITIDYYKIEQFNSNEFDGHEMNNLEIGFNLPFGSGCSEFLPSATPKIEAKSFIMSFFQHTKQAHITMAYDHQLNYLRKETHFHNVRIWDLNEDLLYHIDNSAYDQLTEAVGESLHGPLQRQVDASLVKAQPCSVLTVTDKHLGPEFRPYESISSSIDVIEFLGAKSITYVGRDTVRELPCAVYETVLAEPPKVFALGSEVSSKFETNSKFDYIVQFYLIQTDGSKVAPIGQKSELIQPSLGDQDFWPAQIMLIKRFKETGQSIAYDSLVINDFHWGLFGGLKKPVELFMAPECFPSETDQLRIELGIEFDRQQDRKLLAQNKFKLEKDLVDDLFGLFEVSHLHLIEYELNLRPHNVLFDFVVADRDERKELVFFGAGDIPETAIDRRDRFVLQGLSEEACISLTSLISSVSLTIYCPPKNNFNMASVCTAICDDYEPVISQVSGLAKVDPENPFKVAPVCKAYRFKIQSPPKAATGNWVKWKQLIRNHRIKFVPNVNKESAQIIMTGTVKELDVSHEVDLITINHYKFSTNQLAEDGGNKEQKAPSKVRTIESVLYKSLSDCSKMCNLDPDCRSFSYCSQADREESSATRCVLSSLDVRAAKVEQSLVHAKVGDQQVTVSDRTNALEGEVQYKLELSSSCNIHERDYMSLFSFADEVLYFNADTAKQLRSEQTLFDCAKYAIDAERQAADHHHVALFAYCANSNTCIIDENLFVATKTATNTTGESRPPAGSDNTVNELACNVFRKRYQTYFHVSAHVLPRAADKQIELELTNVEECARACWNKFGNVCASFDYCSPKSCLINSIGTKELATSKLEVRSDCLHYERDLVLDDLRREHMIGRHKLLDSQQQYQVSHTGTTFASVLLNIVFVCLLSGSFVVGLVIGGRVNEKLERVTIIRRSVPDLGRSNFGFTQFVDDNDPVNQDSGRDNIEVENGIYDSAIQLEEFNRENSAYVGSYATSSGGASAYASASAIDNDYDSIKSK